MSSSSSWGMGITQCSIAVEVRGKVTIGVTAELWGKSREDPISRASCSAKARDEGGSLHIRGLIPTRAVCAFVHAGDIRL